MVDTNVVIEVLRRHPEQLRAKFSEHVGQIGVSSITVSELYFGAAKSTRQEKNRRATDQFLNLVTVCDFDSAAAAHAGEIRAVLAARGEPIGPYDVLIAGHARSRGMTVITNNLREFDRVDGLLTDDWTNPSTGGI